MASSLSSASRMAGSGLLASGDELLVRPASRSRAALAARAQSSGETQESASAAASRRTILAASLLAAAGTQLVDLAAAPSASALVPTTAVAGRIPGLSEPDSRGWRTYKRPAGKSGGHGVGWSELIPYSFQVPDGWEEVPVSIADLGGTEIDLRFKSSQGNLSVVVAPVLRFSDTLGSNARIEKIGTPERVINAFGPEVIGQNVEGKVMDMEVVDREGLKYYKYELEPHYLVSITAKGNRLYLIALSANGRQWKKFEPNLREILDSFRVG